MIKRLKQIFHRFSIERKIIQKCCWLMKKYGKSFGIVARVMISTFMPKSFVLGEFVWRICDIINQNQNRIEDEVFLKELENKIKDILKGDTQKFLNLLNQFEKSDIVLIEMIDFQEILKPSQEYLTKFLIGKVFRYRKFQKIRDRFASFDHDLKIIQNQTKKVTQILADSSAQQSEFPIQAIHELLLISTHQNDHSNLNHDHSNLNIDTNYHYEDQSLIHSLMEKNLAKAQSHLKEMIRLKPNANQTKVQQALMSIFEKDFHQSKQYLNEALRNAPQDQRLINAKRLIVQSIESEKNSNQQKVNTTQSIMDKCRALLKKYGAEISLIGKIAISTLLPNCGVLADIFEYLCNEFSENEKDDQPNDQQAQNQFNQKIQDQINQKLQNDQQQFLNIINRLDLQMSQTLLDLVDMKRKDLNLSYEYLTNTLFEKIAQSKQLLDFKNELALLAHEMQIIQKQNEKMMQMFLGLKIDIQLKLKKIIDQLLMSPMTIVGLSIKDATEYLMEDQRMRIALIGNHLSKAKDHLSRIIRLNPSSAKTKSSQVALHLLDRNFKEAKIVAQDALKAYPLDDAIWLLNDPFMEELSSNQNLLIEDPFDNGTGFIDDPFSEKYGKLDRNLNMIDMHSIEMVYCPAGEFWMGSEDGVGDNDEKPRHLVKMTKGFWMGETQVTQELWEKVMGWNPSHFKGKGSGKLPVECVTWYDCLVFCNKLSKLDKFKPCFKLTDIERDGLSIEKANVEWLRNANGYRLPTEAEWEYCAKAGTELIYSGSNNVDEVAWYHVNSGDKTHEVKTKKANAWGLYDMSGNVWEWSMDQWDSNAYQSRDNGIENPLLWENSPCVRVMRGGSYGDRADNCRVASHYGFDADFRYSILGLRLLRCEP